MRTQPLVNPDVICQMPNLCDCVTHASGFKVPFPYVKQSKASRAKEKYYCFLQTNNALFLQRKKFISSKENIFSKNILLFTVLAMLVRSWQQGQACLRLRKSIITPEQKRMKEIHDKAKQLMQGFCRVCKVCDGKACAGEVPGMGGLDTAASFRNNIKALERIQLDMHVLHEICEPDTRCSVLGLDLDMPVLAAPIGGVSFNMGGGLSEEEYIESVTAACKKSGVMACTGDGVPSFIHEAGFAAIKKHEGHGIPFIKPWESDELWEKLEKARVCGCNIFGMDVDAAGLITLRQMGRAVAPKPPAELAKIINTIHDWGAKFILKGIMTPDDASLAVDVGADAIVVSNHGGRVLDHTPGTAQVLPEIAEKVKGRLNILVDGGVRTGTDVFKMLALNADAVMIGRPIAIAAIGGLQQGVEKYLAKVKNQLLQTMILTGRADIDAVNCYRVSYA